MGIDGAVHRLSGPKGSRERAPCDEVLERATCEKAPERASCVHLERLNVDPRSQLDAPA